MFEEHKVQVFSQFLCPSISQTSSALSTKRTLRPLLFEGDSLPPAIEFSLMHSISLSIPANKQSDHEADRFEYISLKIFQLPALLCPVLFLVFPFFLFFLFLNQLVGLITFEDLNESLKLSGLMLFSLKSVF